MRRNVSILLMILFFIWLLPLGIFIKPSNEKVACNGQRAICMCHFHMAKAPRHAMEGFGLKGNAGSPKEEGASSGGAGTYYLAAHFADAQRPHVLIARELTILAYNNPFLTSLEPVPKV